MAYAYRVAKKFNSIHSNAAVNDHVLKMGCASTVSLIEQSGKMEINHLIFGYDETNKSVSAARQRHGLAK